MKRIINFINDESGIETLEYAMIAGIVAAAAVIVYAGGWATALHDKLMNATTVNPAN